MKYKKRYHNPIKLIKTYWPEADIGHIEFDPEMGRADGEYCRIEQCGHDGTAMFTIEMLQRSLLPIVNKATHFKGTEPDWSKVKDIRYKVGPICHAIIFGYLKLRCSESNKYPGQRERVRYPVKCEYILENTEIAHSEQTTND